MAKRTGKEERLKENLLKVGEIAKEAGVLTSTVNYYANIGLLDVSAYTLGRYRLFRKDDALSRFQKIKELKKQGVSIKKIKDTL